VADQLTGTKFLVDTGASYSIFPHKSKRPPSGPRLRGPGGQDIACWGEKEMAVFFGGQRYTWSFLLAAVQFPILGVDFLRANSLIVDAAAGRLIHSKSLRQIPAAEGAVGDGGLYAAVCAAPPAYRDLFAEFQRVLNSSGELPTPTHGVLHQLETTGPPVTAKFRRLDAAKLKAAKEEFLSMERQGIIRRSKSSWASPLHMVRKADGSWRPCGDYRRLNLVTTVDKYPIPNVQDFTARLHGCRVFSKLDLKKGYYQVKVADGDVCKTAVITPFGLWEFLRMPFGLRNAGQTFQRLMDQVLAGLDFVFVYLDDILIASPDEQTHQQHLRAVLERLQEAGLVLNAEKCLFGVSAVEFLGHHITAEGAEPLQQKVAAIADFQRPQDAKGMQRFLGMINFYRRFIQGAAGILRPLTDALRGKPRGRVIWTAAMGAAFQAAKDALCAASRLAHPDPGAEVNLVIDASNSAVGAVLQQRVAAGWQPLAFFSKKLDSAQLNYSAFDRELLAAYLGLRHFRFQLEARRFHILTDHKPLTQALHRISEPWTARQQRQLSYIAEHTSDIRHLAGLQNVVADALSRPPEAAQESPPTSPSWDSRGGKAKMKMSTSSGGLSSGPVGGESGAAVAAVAADSTAAVDFVEMAACQRSCPETAAAKDSSLKLQLLHVGDSRLLCDVSAGRVRPLVPAALRRRVFN
jgi:hypothetical protein